MSFRVETIDHFEKEAKRLIKKFNSLKSEISDLINEIEENPKIGNPIGDGFYKNRLAIRSKGKEKRGGAGVVPYLKIIAETVYLVSIYDKSEKSDIGDKEVKLLLSKLPL